MTQPDGGQKFFPDIYTVAVPTVGGDVVERDRNGEKWQHPDYRAIHMRLEKLPPGLSLEFHADAFGGPATMDKSHGDGTVFRFTEDSGVRTETIQFPGEAPMVIRVSRMV